jgi:hypothetical protein
VPHDCKQYGFSSGPLKSQDILCIPALWPSTNLEMIFIYKYPSCDLFYV